MLPKQSKSMPAVCPICELSLTQQFVASIVADCEICSDCNYLMGLGFSNYDEQPESYLYPVSWIYDRLQVLTGRSYVQNKRLWLNEVVASYQELSAKDPETRQEFELRRGVTPEQALQQIRQDIERVEQLLICEAKED